MCNSATQRNVRSGLRFFDITPDYDLNLMKPNQNLYELTATIIESLKPILEELTPDYVFVHGDTTTTMAGSIASFYSGAKVCHVEAGLRTNNKLSPFPEELNRQITGRICDYHFTPTETSKNNLLNENISEDSILVSGNTVIDALLRSVKKVNENPSKLIQQLSKKIKNQQVVLVTGHRRENHGSGFERICKALKRIAKDDTNRLIIYPVLNPKVRGPVNRILHGINNIILIDPLAYQDLFG